jgi:hypothetical protein
MFFAILKLLLLLKSINKIFLKNHFFEEKNNVKNHEKVII